VINTGASQKSTVGYNQFLNYGKIYPATIDTTRAGQVTVQFGIGGVSSIGSVIIQTSIGNMEFYIVQADTPFLLCLTDMDTLKVYYNNLTDCFVTPERSIPIIRRFGHRLATVRSGPRPEPFLETVKKTGLYGLVN
jgi:hypothetical protein